MARAGKLPLPALPTQRPRESPRGRDAVQWRHVVTREGRPRRPAAREPENWSRGLCPQQAGWASPITAVTSGRRLAPPPLSAASGLVNPCGSRLRPYSWGHRMLRNLAGVAGGVSTQQSCLRGLHWAAACAWSLRRPTPSLTGSVQRALLL